MQIRAVVWWLARADGVLVVEPHRLDVWPFDEASRYEALLADLHRIDGHHRLDDVEHPLEHSGRTSWRRIRIDRPRRSRSRPTALPAVRRQIGFVDGEGPDLPCAVVQDR